MKQRRKRVSFKADGNVLRSAVIALCPTSSSHQTEDVTFQHLCKRCRMVLKATFFQFNNFFFSKSTSSTASPRRNIAFPQANSYLTAGQAQIEVGVIKRGYGCITSWKSNIRPPKKMMTRKKMFLSAIGNFGIHVGLRVCIFLPSMGIQKSSPMTTEHAWQDGNVYFSSKTCVYRRAKISFFR